MLATRTRTAAPTCGTSPATAGSPPCPTPAATACTRSRSAQRQEPGHRGPQRQHVRVERRQPRPHGDPGRPGHRAGGRGRVQPAQQDAGHRRHGREHLPVGTGGSVIATLADPGPAPCTASRSAPAARPSPPRHRRRHILLTPPPTPHRHPGRPQRPWGVRGRVQPGRQILATAGQDGNAYLWNVAKAAASDSDRPGQQPHRVVGLLQPERQDRGHRRLERRRLSVGRGHRAAHRQPERTQPRQRRGNVAVAFSPDGKIVATANLNGVTYLWGIATGRTRR